MLYATNLRPAGALLCAIALSATGEIASASPGQGITPQVLVTSTLVEDTVVNHDRIKVQTKDPVTVRVQKQTFAPGSFSGWHHHPGAVVVAIQSGSVSFTDANCNSKTYGPGMPDGSVFLEGDDGPHEASSSSGAVAYVTVLAPGSVFRIEDEARSCP
jgi:quercetin dioxygenase-like cupin family protein